MDRWMIEEKFLGFSLSFLGLVPFIDPRKNGNPLCSRTPTKVPASHFALYIPARELIQRVDISLLVPSHEFSRRCMLTSRFLLFQGGFARVYLMTDVSNGSQYACKIIPKNRMQKIHMQKVSDNPIDRRKEYIIYILLFCRLSKTSTLSVDRA